MRSITAIIILILLLFAAGGRAQNASAAAIDTVKIYKHRSGVRYRIYERTWFYGIGISRSYGYPVAKVNKQDSIVIKESNKPVYFKVYGRNDRLILEGERPAFSHELIGDVKYYYRNGKVKRIEHFSTSFTRDTCGHVLYMSDGPGASGTWKYLRRNGTVRKRLDYSIPVFSCNPLSYCLRKTITRYSRRGRVRSLQHKHWYCYVRDKKERGPGSGF